MGGYRAIIIQVLEGNFKIQMIFGGICHYENQSLLEFRKESGESSEFGQILKAFKVNESKSKFIKKHKF